MQRWRNKPFKQKQSQSRFKKLEMSLLSNIYFNIISHLWPFQPTHKKRAKSITW